jgi:hypothetical protein
VVGGGRQSDRVARRAPYLGLTLGILQGGSLILVEGGSVIHQASPPIEAHLLIVLIIKCAARRQGHHQIVQVLRPLEDRLAVGILFTPRMPLVNQPKVKARPC